MNKKTKQFLVNKFAENWMKENKEFVADYSRLCEEILLFRMKWGVEIGIILKNSEDAKGRELGKGFEELFDAQAFTEKSKKYAEKRFTDITKPQHKNKI